MKKNPVVSYTRKQMGDACEMLVAAEMTLAGVPALKVPDNWPGYDIIAQPSGKAPQRISVKARTFKDVPNYYVEYLNTDVFDWIAIVLLNTNASAARKTFIIPRSVADKTARQNKPGTKYENQRYWVMRDVPKIFSAFENNYLLALK